MSEEEITAEGYADWKAPQGDGEVLVWPEGQELVRQTRENQRRFSAADGCLIQGVPLAKLRREMRGFIGHDDAVPLVATGHQTELYHPGVWVKNALVDRLAEAAGGSGYLFAVDTDEPKHLNLRWPPGTSVPVTDDPRLTVAAWTGLLAPPTPAHVGVIEEELTSARGSWGFEPVAGGFIRSMRRLCLEAESLAPTLVNALHELDWSLGLRHHAMTVSPMFQARQYLLFVHHMMARTGEVAEEYNRALADYRREQGIKSPGRPMPDLVTGEVETESPFWVDELETETRTRAKLTKVAGGYSLAIFGGEFVFTAASKADDAADQFLGWLRRHNVRIAPRALTLTTFLRLFLADQFVHGIGGGRYDQVADRFIRRAFGIEPPCFSVTTATLYFPTAIGRERACIPCLLREGRRIRHGALGDEKRHFVDEMAVLPRGSVERRAAYYEMHRRMKDVASPMLTRWEERLVDARRQGAEEELLFDRELFYGLQSRERLQSLAARYAELVPA